MQIILIDPAMLREHGMAAVQNLYWNVYGKTDP